MEAIFFPSGVISIFFMALWLIQYPQATFEAAKFDDRSKQGIFAGVIFWIFFFLSIWAIVRICSHV